MPKGKRIEPLNIDDLETSSSLSGMMAFRERPIGLTPIGLGQETSYKQQQPDCESKTKSEIIQSAPVGARPIGAESNSAPPSDLTDVFTHLAEDPPVAKSRGKVVPATKVEDGHSATQNTVYWHLWRKGKQVDGRRSHFIQAGYGQIQSALGIDRSNVQDAIRELQKKLAIQIIKASTVGSATVYEIFCCEEILEKRRTAGLIWAHRYGARKVELLTNPESWIGAKPIGLMPTGPYPVGFNCSGGDRPTAPMGFPPIEGIGVTPIHLAKEVKSKKTSSSDAVQIRRFIESKVAPMDNDAAERLLRDCRAKAGDQFVTVDHVLSVVAGKVVAARSARNPIGLLIESVPKHFPLPVSTIQPVNEELRSDDREYWEQVITNPDAPEPLREEARRELGRRGYWS